MNGRTGRRPGDSGTREAILAAARESFATSGYTGTTIRGVARQAGVDPALVHHYFGRKDELFTAALELPVDPAEVVARLLENGTEGLGERLLRRFLTVWDATPGQGPLLALLRSALSHDASAVLLREFVTDVVLGPLARAANPDRPELRASLIGSQLVGLAMARYVVRVEPLASADADVLAPLVAPTIDRYLVGRLP